MIDRFPAVRAAIRIAGCVVLVAGTTVTAGASDVRESRTPSVIAWQAAFTYDHAVVTVSGPAGVTKWSIVAGSPLAVSVEMLAAWAETAGAPVDGEYTYEIVFAPLLSDEDRRRLAVLRDTADGQGLAEGPVVLLPRISGTIRLANGVIVGTGPSAPERSIATKDVVHPDDVIVTGSLCVGADCYEGISFGYDSIVQRENNLRMFFDDTSTIQNYPRNDWRIEINDSVDGGASYFAIQDATNGTNPFRIKAGAPANSLYVGDDGRVGFGTATPAYELHVKDSDTPTLRLEQDNSGGWSPQTWDVGGHEGHFFVRDATHGSMLPLRIEPNTPSDTLTLKYGGKVGIGTWSPTAKLEVETTGEPATLLLHRTDGGQWYLTSTADGTFTVGTSATEGEELLILDALGNLTTSGTVNGVSDRAKKKDFEAVDAPAILDAIGDLAIAEWSLADDPAGTRHVGPTAQDFRAVFGLGADERHIALADLSGVALAAIQALATRLEERDAEIERLNQRLNELETRFAASH